MLAPHFKMLRIAQTLRNQQSDSKGGSPSKPSSPHTFSGRNSMHQNTQHNTSNHMNITNQFQMQGNQTSGQLSEVKRMQAYPQPPASQQVKTRMSKFRGPDFSKMLYSGQNPLSVQATEANNYFNHTSQGFSRSKIATGNN